MDDDVMIVGGLSLPLSIQNQPPSSWERDRRGGDKGIIKTSVHSGNFHEKTGLYGLQFQILQVFRLIACRCPPL